MLERDIESWSKRLADKYSWWHKKFKSPGNRSAPDQIFAKNARVFWVEFKATGVPVTEKQHLYHEEMRAAGLTVYVCDSREGFGKILIEEERMYGKKWEAA